MWSGLWAFSGSGLVLVGARSNPYCSMSYFGRKRNIRRRTGETAGMPKLEFSYSYGVVRTPYKVSEERGRNRRVETSLGITHSFRTVPPEGSAPSLSSLSFLWRSARNLALLRACPEEGAIGDSRLPCLSVLSGGAWLQRFCLSAPYLYLTLELPSNLLPSPTSTSIFYPKHSYCPRPTPIASACCPRSLRTRPRDPADSDELRVRHAVPLLDKLFIPATLLRCRQ